MFTLFLNKKSPFEISVLQGNNLLRIFGQQDCLDPGDLRTNDQNFLTSYVQMICSLVNIE